MCELSKRFQTRRPLLTQLATRLETEVKEALEDAKHIDRVAFRVKTVTSFVAKATDPANDPPYVDPLVEIEDQVAGRVITFFRSDLPAVRQIVLRSFSPVEQSERRPLRDAEFGYESDHLILIIPIHLKPSGWSDELDLPTTFELQIRTLFMHAWAEPQHDFGYKGPTELPRDIKRELSWIAASAWGADAAYERIRGANGRP